MVDNLAEKVDECPLNRVSLLSRREGASNNMKVLRTPLNRGCHVNLLAYNWDRENCPLYGVAGCPLFRASIEMNGRRVGTFIIVHYIMGVCFSEVSVKRDSTVVLQIV